MREGVLRYSMALRRQSALAQSAQLPGNFAPGKVLVWHRLRWVGAGVLAILLTAQTAWMMKPHTVPQITRPVANSQPNPQPNTQSGDQMSDDELLEAVNNDLSRDVPQALAPVSAITLARNQIAAETSKSNESSR